MSNDPARPTIQCQSYRDGHGVHWIPILRLVPGLAPSPARLQVDTDGFLLEVAGLGERIFNHDPVRVTGLIEAHGTECQWYSSLHFVCWLLPGSRPFANMSFTQLEPCSPFRPLGSLLR